MTGRMTGPSYPDFKPIFGENGPTPAPARHPIFRHLLSYNVNITEMPNAPSPSGGPWTIEVVSPDESGVNFYLTQYKPFRLLALQESPACKSTPNSSRAW